MLPQSFTERMQGLLESEYEEFLASFEHEKYQALRLNPLKKDDMSVITEKVKQTFQLQPVPWAENGYYYTKEDQPGKHPWHEAGLYYIQEPSAMAPVTLLSPQPGERILDLCAAPGGKSTQIASAMEGEGLLVTNEIHPARAKILSENVERMGIRNACVLNETPEHLADIFEEYFDRILVDAPCSGERILDLCAAPGGKSTQIASAMEGEGLLVTNEIHPARAKILSENVERMGIRNACVLNETPEHLADIFEEYFDRILVDAPCSGEGMFRKNEVACEEWSPENVQLCADRQDGILECAARMLVPGGRLVYSTCTFASAENEGSISRFLAKHEEFEIVPIDKKALGIPEGCDGIPGCVENPAPGIEGTLRLWPHKLKGEGHYAAVLQKKGKLPEGCQPVSATGPEKGIPAKNLTKDWAEYFNFAKETFSEEQTIKAGLCTAGEGFLAFGDNLYRMPERMPGVKGLKVLRPGLHLGTLKKNRFEPAHALALALRPEDVKHVWKLSEEEAATYLKGQTFSAEGEKGWYLICVDGCSLGWGKLAGGVMKNHYPKGLRK